MDKKEKQRIASAKWYQKNKDQISLSRKGQRQEEHKSYYQRNRERMLAKTREWQKANPDKVKATQRKSRAKNDAKRLFNLVRLRAKNKELDFNLTLDYVGGLIPDCCPYLRVPFIYGDKDRSMSVDRIDNTKGYIIGNIEIISTKANRMKNTASIAELLVFAKAILDKYKDF